MVYDCFNHITKPPHWKTSGDWGKSSSAPDMMVELSDSAGRVHSDRTWKIRMKHEPLLSWSLAGGPCHVLVGPSKYVFDVFVCSTLLKHISAVFGMLIPMRYISGELSQPTSTNQIWLVSSLAWKREVGSDAKWGENLASNVHVRLGAGGPDAP